MKRDDYFRCRWCKGLFPDAQCARDEVTDAYLCPNGCREPFNQPEYESPLQD